MRKIFRQLMVHQDQHERIAKYAKRNNINIVGAVEKAITMLEKKESKK